MLTGFSLLVLCVAGGCFLQGCSPEHAKQLEFGRPIPDARLLITLPEPADRFDLSRKFADLAATAEYTKHPKIAESRDAFYFGSVPYVFTFGTSKGDKQYPHRMTLAWPYESTAPTEITFILHGTHTKGFTATEWRLFFEWKDRLIPTQFPDAEITISRHPAEVTAYDDLLSISGETGIPVPEGVLTRFREWQARKTE